MKGTISLVEYTPRVCMAISATAIRMLAAICKPSLAFEVRPKIPPVHYFDVVVGESDGGESAGGKHCDPDKEIAEVGPQQRRNHDGDRDQQAAHGRSAGLLLMRLGTFFANELADLKFAQTVDDDRADDECGEKRGEAGERCTKRQVPKNTEWRKVMKQLQVQQPVEQSASVSVVSRRSSVVRNVSASAVLDLLTTED